MTELCPCDSGLVYQACCEPYIQKNQYALSPSKLMRSRYTAYVKQKIDYLIATWHPDCKAEQWREAIVQRFNTTEWKGLVVIAEEKGASLDEGYVEFIARFTDKETDHGIMHERSRFLRLEQRWYYIDGSRPQIGRNAACRCGSGKKYKKCCGR